MINPVARVIAEGKGRVEIGSTRCSASGRAQAILARGGSEASAARPARERGEERGGGGERAGRERRGRRERGERGTLRKREKGTVVLFAIISFLYYISFSNCDEKESERARKRGRRREKTSRDDALVLAKPIICVKSNGEWMRNGEGCWKVDEGAAAATGR
jgi:hypothetical protein